MMRVLFMNAANSMKEKILSVIDSALLEYSNMHGEIAVAYEKNILWHHSFSYNDAPWVAPKNSQYLIGSITKQFTAVALLKALEDLDDKSNKDAHENIIDALHKPISSFFNHNLNNIFNNEVPSWVGCVSLHHLLTHTSGIKKENETMIK
jgi:CubicO group peptidase (beta-lactamase class C family)